MTYGIESFDASFFALPDETNGKKYPHGDNPYSVYGAIMAMDDDDYEAMCEDVFGCEAEFVDADMVMTKIQETNTCTDLSSPVEVWIDEEGFYTVTVHNRHKRRAS